jgi:hypothetical protein
MVDLLNRVPGCRSQGSATSWWRIGEGPGTGLCIRGFAVSVGLRAFSFPRIGREGVPMGHFGRRTGKVGGRGRWRAVPAVAGATLLAGAVLTGAAAHATVTTVTLYTSTAPGYHPGVATVPPGICAVEVSVAGGPGGAGFDGTDAPAGGTGAALTATVVVSPGEVLDAEVGGAGQSAATAGEATESFDAGNGGVGGGGGGGINADGNGQAGGGGGGGWVAGGVGGGGGQLGSDGGDGSGDGNPATTGAARGGTASGVPREDSAAASYGGGTQYLDTPEYGDPGPNDGNGTVGGGGDGGGQGAYSPGPNPPNELGGDGTGAPGTNFGGAEGPVGDGGAGNSNGGDGGNGGTIGVSDGYHGVGTEGVGGAGGGGGIGFAGGGGSDAGGGGGGWDGGDGTTYGNPGGGGGGSSYVATNVDGGSALSPLSTGEVTISYDVANDRCGQTVFYASATAAPGSGGGATPADPCDLAEALLRVPAGGTVYLVTPGADTAPSRYVGNFTVTTPGTTSLTPVTIESLPGLSSPPILDGDGPDAPPGEVCQTPPIPRDPIDYSPDLLFPACIKQVLTVPSGAHVALEGTTVADAGYGGYDVEGFGGGLDAEGDVTVLNDSFDDNATAGTGGAIVVGVAGSVAVTDSTFTANSANGDGRGDGGGAISNETNGPHGSVAYGGMLSVTGSTFDGNTSDEGGGAIITANSTPITDSTFIGNSSAQGGGALNGYPYIVIHSTFAANIDANGGPNLYGEGEVTADIFDGACDHGPAFVDDGYNVGTDATCFGASPPSTDAQAADLHLGPLAANGGPTETVEPEAGSPAVGVIPAATIVTVDGSATALCPTVDQRGVPSVPGTTCDTGSVQTAAAVPPPTLPEVADPALLAIPALAIGGFVVHRRRRRPSRQV